MSKDPGNRLELEVDATQQPESIEITSVPKLHGIQRTAETVAQDAVNETGFGKFNLKVLAVCILIYMNVAFSITSVAFILPAAACDFKMTTVDKGRLSASPMLGMACGSYIWGCYAVLKGRKMSLLIALFLHGSSELLASIVPSYWVFLFLKFISGAAMNGQLTVVFMYLVEFQPTKHRDRMLSWMEMAWVLGILTLAGVAWIIIPLNITTYARNFPFHSWNLFVMICSFPALFIGTWLSFFPETPKYLAEIGQNVKMLNVLMRMYSENTGELPEEYITKLKTSGNHSLVELITRIIETKEVERIEGKSAMFMIKDVCYKTMMILRPPFVNRTILICLISCFVTSSYYMLTLWLPELFHRYADLEQSYPNRSANVYTLTIHRNTTKELSNGTFHCNPTIQNSVFVYTFILGASCIPAALVLPILVKYIGYKTLLVITTVIPGVVTVCLFLVKTSIQNLILSCIFEAITSVCVSVIYCLQVELYPTHLRAMAAGLSALITRIGAIGGNLMIGYLIDNYSVLLILIVAGQLFVSGAFALFIPGRNNIEKTENNIL